MNLEEAIALYLYLQNVNKTEAERLQFQDAWKMIAENALESIKLGRGYSRTTLATGERRK